MANRRPVVLLPDNNQAEIPVGDTVPWSVLDDAPANGKQYARKDAAWSEVVSGGGGDRNVDGGVASSIYLPSQVVDGGSASG